MNKLAEQVPLPSVNEPSESAHGNIPASIVSGNILGNDGSVYEKPALSDTAAFTAESAPSATSDELSSGGYLRGEDDAPTGLPKDLPAVEITQSNQNITSGHINPTHAMGGEDTLKPAPPIWASPKAATKPSKDERNSTGEEQTAEIPVPNKVASMRDLLAQHNVSGAPTGEAALQNAASPYGIDQDTTPTTHEDVTKPIPSPLDERWRELAGGPAARVTQTNGSEATPDDDFNYLEHWDDATADGSEDGTPPDPSDDSSLPEGYEVDDSKPMSLGEFLRVKTTGAVSKVGDRVGRLHDAALDKIANTKLGSRFINEKGEYTKLGQGIIMGLGAAALVGKAWFQYKGMALEGGHSPVDVAEQHRPAHQGEFFDHTFPDITEQTSSVPAPTTEPSVKIPSILPMPNDEHPEMPIPSQSDIAQSTNIIPQSFKLDRPGMNPWSEMQFIMPVDADPAEVDTITRMVLNANGIPYDQANSLPFGKELFIPEEVRALLAARR